MKKKRIMIADDDESLLEMLKIVLGRSGYETTTTLGGKSLLDFPPENVDLILLDVRMSGMNGLDICEHLKSQEATKNIPIVLISAVPELPSLTEKSSADDYLEKPFNMAELLDKVEKYVHKN